MEIVVTEISRDGKVEMEFNQDLATPIFDSMRRLRAGRKLIALKDIDVARDLIDIKFKS